MSDGDLPHTSTTEVTPVMVVVGVSKFLPDQIGVIAARSIKKGTIIGGMQIDPIEEKLCPWSEYKNFDSATKVWIDKYCLGTPDGFIIIGNPNFWPAVWNMNHSCNGNAGFDENFNFVAMHDIDAGEEICYDYGLGESNPKFSMVCKCGLQHCRGEITGNDWKKLQRNPKLANFMMPDLRS